MARSHNQSYDFGQVICRTGRVTSMVVSTSSVSPGMISAPHDGANQAAIDPRDQSAIEQPGGVRSCQSSCGVVQPTVRIAPSNSSSVSVPVFPVGSWKAYMRPLGGGWSFDFKVMFTSWQRTTREPVGTEKPRSMDFRHQRYSVSRRSSHSFPPAAAIESSSRRLHPPA